MVADFVTLWTFVSNSFSRNWNTSLKLVIALLNEIAKWSILSMSYFIPKSKAVGIMEKDPTILEEESNYSCMSNPIKHA